MTVFTKVVEFFKWWDISHNKYINTIYFWVLIFLTFVISYTSFDVMTRAIPRLRNDLSENLISEADALYWSTLRITDVLTDIMFMIIIGFVFLALFSVCFWIQLFRTRRSTLQGDRLALLAEALSNSSEIIGKIESELKLKQELIKTLEQEVKDTEQLIELNAEETAAIRGLVAKTVEKQSQQDNRQEVALNIVFLVLGIALTLFLKAIGVPL